MGGEGFQPPPLWFFLKNFQMADIKKVKKFYSSLFNFIVVNKFCKKIYFIHMVGWRTVKRRVAVSKISEMVNIILLIKLQEQERDGWLLPWFWSAPRILKLLPGFWSKMWKFIRPVWKVEPPLSSIFGFKELFLSCKFNNFIIYSFALK